MLANAQANLIVTNGEYLSMGQSFSQPRQCLNIDKMDYPEEWERPDITLTPDDFAYIFYTSGSTGLPKGVSENHRNLLFHVRAETNEYRLQSRGGKGIITMKTTDKTGRVVGAQQVTEDDQLMLVTNTGKIIRLRIKDIRVIGRNTQGVRLIDIDEGERVVSLARVAEKEDEDESSLSSTNGVPDDPV